MTGKHHNWHKAWQRQADGSLLHDTGLRLLVRPADGGATDLEADGESLLLFQVREQARGVPMHDLQARLQRLLQEGARWHVSN